MTTHHVWYKVSNDNTRSVIVMRYSKYSLSCSTFTTIWCDWLNSMLCMPNVRSGTIFIHIQVEILLYFCPCVYIQCFLTFSSSYQWCGRICQHLLHFCSDYFRSIVRYQSELQHWPASYLFRLGQLMRIRIRLSAAWSIRNQTCSRAICHLSFGCRVSSVHRDFLRTYRCDLCEISF